MMNEELQNRSFPNGEGDGEMGRITWTVIIYNNADHSKRMI